MPDQGPLREPPGPHSRPGGGRRHRDMPWPPPGAPGVPQQAAGPPPAASRPFYRAAAADRPRPPENGRPSEPPEPDDIAEPSEIEGTVAPPREAVRASRDAGREPGETRVGLHGGIGAGVAREEHGPLQEATDLLRYLRDLARARRGVARDVDAYGQVHWLAELPGDVYVEAEAGPGEVLFSVPVIPLSPPAVIEEFDGWLAMRHWYRTLRDLAAQGQELVLATGLLSWQPGTGPGIRDHLLTTPVRIVVDERTERVDVVLTGHTSLRDRELLGGLSGFRPARTDWVWDAVQAGQGFGLRASVSDVLRKWCTVAFTGTDVAAVFREDWASGQGAAPIPQLRLAPAIVVRPPDRGGLADHYDKLLAWLARPGARVPGGIARFLAPGSNTRILHVPDRTPRTSADLLTGLLTRGRRVLVASPEADRLHAALPAEIGMLCATTDEADVLERLRSRGVAHDPRRHRAWQENLAERGAAADRTVNELRERLALTEATDVVDLAPGYRGARAELERRLAAEAPEHSWLPPLTGMPERPPVNGAQAAELQRLLGEETPRRRARTGQRDVDPGSLPSAAYVRTLIDAEAVAAERAERSQTELSRRLRQCDVAFLARLDGCAATVTAALEELGLAGHPREWDPGDPAARAFSDALSNRRPTLWARVAEMAPQAEWARHALASIAGRDVRLPPGELHLRQLAAAAQELRNHLADGGVLKRGPLRSAAQRAAEPLLTGARVDGHPPTTPELLDVVFVHLMIRMSSQELQYVWEAVGATFPDAPAEKRVVFFARAHDRLAVIRRVLPSIEESCGLLAGIGVQVTHPVQWHGYVIALENALLGLKVNRATADLTALRDSIGVLPEGSPPELVAAVNAIDERDAAAYASALSALAEVRHERALQVRCEGLYERLRAAHPELAGLLAGGPPVRRWEQAWAWAYASSRLAELPRSAAESRLRTALAEAEAQLEGLTDALAGAQAWEACLTRFDPEAPAVPAWIAPLWQIPALVSAEPDAFDVVIIDGEHEAGAEALFLLWPAPRVILVGQSGDALPAPADEVPADLLADDLRELVTPTAPLFEILLTRFVPPAPGALQAAPEPPPAPEQPVPAGPVTVERGRSIVSYKRPELIQIVRRLAASEPGLSDDRLLERARELLGCPEDEDLLVGARLRYAVEAYREEADRAAE
ncbi:hypothetical protein ACGFNU_24010 [Spirillospora sp. NPDC048911]|uniref:hypothetical protein n=1 Tax=Spirillospora sp. NPDC048911 TaxID=3364527 RepID=UPI00372384D8